MKGEHMLKELAVLAALLLAAFVIGSALGALTFFGIH